MQRLRLDFTSDRASISQTFDVPDIATALVVAEINLAQGKARIHDGDRLVATLEKRGRGRAPYWLVDQP